MRGCARYLMPRQRKGKKQECRVSSGPRGGVIGARSKPLQKLRIIVKFLNNGIHHTDGILWQLNVLPVGERYDAFWEVTNQKNMAPVRKRTLKAHLLVHTERIDKRDAASLTAQLEEQAVGGGFQ